MQLQCSNACLAAMVHLKGAGRGVAQPGSASALGAGGRVFESHRPDQSTRQEH